jgi:RecA/RadA recombinase
MDKNNSIENDYQFCGLISGMKRYKTIKLGPERINNRSIVEITGEAGSGKSKLCYYFALKTILPEKYGGLEKSCLFIRTFSPLPDEKKTEFFENPTKPLGLSEEEIQSTRQRLVYRYLDFEDFQRFINKDFEKFLLENRIQTIIIDNITCLCDEKFQEKKRYDYPGRHNFLFDFFLQLDGLILKYNLFCFCVNEVRALIDHEGGIYYYDSLRPALGKTWENNLGTRLFLKRDKKIDKRWIEVPFSNYLIRQYMEYKITENGIQFLD